MPNGLNSFVGGLLDSPAFRFGVGVLGAPRDATFGQGLLGATNNAFEQQRQLEEERRRQLMRELMERQESRIAANQAFQMDQALDLKEREAGFGEYMRGLFENAPPLPPNATQQQRDQRTTTLRRGILEGQNQFGLPMDTGLLTYQPRQLVGNITVGSPESQQLKSYYAVQEDRAGKLFEEIGKRQARYAPLKESVRILEESLDNVTAGVGPAAKLLGRALTLGGVSQDTISELGLGDVGSTELFTARSQQGAVQLMAAIGQALGPYSDKDLSIFIKSMPSLWNTKEGNRLILTFLSYSIRKAEAADRFVDDYWNDNKVTPSIGQIEDFKNQYDQKNRPKVLVNSQESIDKASQSEPAWTTTREADSLPPGADYISEYRNAAGARVIIYKLGDKQYRATEQQP